jgi:creatinine amidohydrolase/Fe(II)-dependent formamide hydrolase-like protein
MKLAESGRELGVGAAEQGQHAGELETSILAALRPDGVRMSELREGLRVESGDAQRLFYPSLRENAPTGVVGDPRRASASRGDLYLDVWAEELVRFYLSAADEAAEASARSGALRT